MSTQLDTIYAGATLDYLIETLTDYPASAGWSLKLVLNPLAGGTVRTIDSVADGDAHRLQSTAATTGAWVAGAYGRQVWVIKGTEQYPVTDLFGQTQVMPGLGAAAGTDSRLPAQRRLDTLRAAYDTYIQSGNFAVGSYSINGRSMTYRSPEELITAIRNAERDVERERVEQNIKAGLGGRKAFYVRM
jgi:hypothetical protein